MRRLAKMQLVFLEMNEINFDYIRGYAERGKLPVLSALIAEHGVVETTSERNDEELEPWIQWVTAHTGKPLSQHGIFRLGDIVRHDIPQIWEVLEAQGLSVGAISPMNANNSCRGPAFFMPDPWTPATVTGPALMQRLYGAVAQAVNDNAQARLTPSSMAWLAMGLAAYARPTNYAQYGRLALAALRGRPWTKPLILDQLLADLFIRQVRSKRPDFASLFLNAGAHIQHHYMFNSPIYSGGLKNPEWYIAQQYDPLLEVYELYDRIVGQVQRAFPDARLMLATGLHQDPHPEVTFYWRLKDHAEYLRKVGVPFQKVEPRMSRDFVVYCADAREAAEAERRLNAICAINGTPLFEIDNRGSDLFVMLTWPHDIPTDFEYRVDNMCRRDLHNDVAFVAIKNGQHNGIGYFLDTGAKADTCTASYPLTQLPQRIAAACGVAWST